VGERPSPLDPKVSLPLYRLPIREFRAKVHPDLPPTRLWGYDGASPGPTITARSGDGLFVEWANELPEAHFLPVDHTLHGAEVGQPGGRAVVHVHGGRVPPESDGYPEDFWLPGQSKTYFYPNGQDAATLWYHDHTMGINRLNIYAGLFGLYIVRDAAEEALGLPRGSEEIPLVLCDRSFTPDGQLDYPAAPDGKAPWVPEVFGNTMLINGVLSPYLDVEPRTYRFRILNASNGRFLHLSLSTGDALTQIASDQGLLGAAVPLKLLTLAPGERADVLVDFSRLGGARPTLKNDIGEILQFRVGAGTSTSFSVPSPRALERIPESSAVRTRLLTLEEYTNFVGHSMTMLLNGAHWTQPVTEKPLLGTTEVWSLINLTDDSHPIHLHLVRFQILDRRRFEPFTFQTTGVLKYTGPPVPPEANEAGWKDTAAAHPGMVTRIIVPFLGFPGRYVWHCHILEHEDNEMMRPFEILRPEAAPTP
jgi:spore coat protein A